MDKRPNFSNFVRAFGSRWFTAMSGPLSVPLAVAAVFVPNDIAKLLLALTAIACAIFASYWVWRRERQQAIVSEQQLAPKIVLHFEEAEPFVYTMRLSDNT
jgi:hypothetical protein